MFLDRFGIQGIPALIVLDTISGTVVVQKEQSRSEVVSSCQRGDEAIKHLFTNTWMNRIPSESQVISCFLYSFSPYSYENNWTKFLSPLQLYKTR